MQPSRFLVLLMVQKAMWSMASLFHAEMPTTTALSSIGCFLALVQIEIETHATVVVIHANTSFVLELCRENVGCAFSFAFSLSTSFGT